MKISEMMNTIEDTSVDLKETPLVSSEKIKEATMRKINANEDTIKFRKRGSTPKVIAIAAAVAVVGCGTALAATGVLNFNFSKTDAPHVAEISVTEEGESAITANVSEIPEVNTVIGYMPEGYTLNEKNMYTSADHAHGFSVGAPMYIDTAETFSQSYLLNGEKTTIAGRDALYMEMNYGIYEDSTLREVYMIYPDTNRMGYIWAYGNMDKDELFKVAENLEFQPTGNMIAPDEEKTWSKFVEYKNEEWEELQNPENTVYGEGLSMEADTIDSLSKIGDMIDITGYPSEIEACISDVTITDSLELLTDDAQIPDGWKELVAENGTLGMVTRDYVVFGNGSTNMNQIVRTEEVPAKLVFVTAEYKNTGTEDLEDVLVFASMDLYAEKDGAYIEKLCCGDDYDEIVYQNSAAIRDMLYFTAEKGDAYKNHIELKSGETATVHMAWIVGEDDLFDMFLRIDKGAGAESGQQMIDIRQ